MDIDRLILALEKAEYEKDYYRKLYFQKLNNEKLNNSHNPRGAGRKSKFTDSEINMIKELRSTGKTIKEISKTFNCSVGLIHKLINKK